MKKTLKFKSLITLMLILIIIIIKPMSVNASINIRSGAADEDLAGLQYCYETTGDTSTLDLIIDIADGGGFSVEIENQARSYVAEQRNVLTSVDEPTTAPKIETPAASKTEPTTVPAAEPAVESPDKSTIAPTTTPTTEPTTVPAAEPAVESTDKPTIAPTTAPTTEPTTVPAAEPDAVSTDKPTVALTNTPAAPHDNQLSFAVISIPLLSLLILAAIVVFVIRRIKRRQK